MKDTYFKYEYLYITFGLVALAFILVGCSQPIKTDFEKYEEYYCAGNGFWYKKTGTTKLEIIMKDGKFLPCADERL